MATDSSQHPLNQPFESLFEAEGTELEVAGNTPFILEPSDMTWYVQEGKLEVFAVAIENGEPSGPRSHFVSVGKGQLLLGMDFEGYGMGAGFLAVGKVGTHLRRIPLSRLQEMSADGGTRAAISNLLDAWVVRLSQSLTRDIPASSRADLSLAGETELEVDGDRIRSGRGVLWQQVEEGELLFIGMETLAFDKTQRCFPITPYSWMESAALPVTIKTVRTEQLINDPAFWTGLERFHEVLCQCEFINKRLAAVDEFNRLKTKSEYSQAARESAYQELGAVLEQQSELGPLRKVTATEDPLLEATRLVASSQGIEIREHPELSKEAEDLLRLARIARTSRFRTREVKLSPGWWKKDQGPFLGTYRESGQPIALLPKKSKSYRCIDPVSGSEVKIDATVATRISNSAIVFYRPFQEGSLTALDLARFGIRGLRRDLLAVLLLGVLLGLLGSLVPYFTGQVFDWAIPQASSSSLVQFTFAILVIAVSSSAFQVAQGIAVLRLDTRMDYSIQAALWDRLLNLPARFFKGFSAGDLANRAAGIDAIRALIVGSGVSAILGAVSSVFYLALMSWYNVGLALVALVLTFFYLLVTSLANYVQLQHQRRESDVSGRLSGLVLQLISGIAKLRVSGAENHALRVWASDYARLRRARYRIGRIQNHVTVFGSAFSIISSMVIYAALASMTSGTSAFETGLTTGQFIGFSVAFGIFLGAMSTLSDASLSVIGVVPIFQRLKPIITTPLEVDRRKAYPGHLTGEIEVSHLHFRYDNEGPWILRDVSLTVRPGEFVAFVGSSGSGKSTLLRLLLGFETPQKGSVYFDGQDLNTLDMREVRQQLGIVLQDGKLLPSNIFRNIIGESLLTLEDAWEAARMAGLAEDIEAMPMGMHTYVAEGGAGFSGGQKQRLLLARAIARKPRIMFLDEATSAMDNRNQALVTESLDRLQATRIAVAHRLSTVINADTIYVLEEGQIIEYGNHKDLMQRGGRFTELARRQII